MAFLVSLATLGLAPAGFAQTASPSISPVASVKVEAFGIKAKALVQGTDQPLTHKTIPASQNLSLRSPSLRSPLKATTSHATTTSGFTAPASTQSAIFAASAFHSTSTRLASSGPAYSGTAFNGTHILPGTVQCEDYDQGGEGVGYHDADTGNNGGAYRSDDVDIEGCGDAGGGYDVGWTYPGEWLGYTVQVQNAGTYLVSVRASSLSGGGGFHFEDESGTNLTGPITVPATGSYLSYTTVTASATLTAGSHVLRLVEDSGGYNLNWIAFAVPSSPIRVLAINASGGADPPFVADTDYSGGNGAGTGAAIDTSGIANPAPQSVYQTERWGNFTYTLPGLTPGAVYTLRLHFAELYYGPGRRQFNVIVNGTQVLTNFDIAAVAGGANKAVIQSFSATANASGQIVVQFATGAADAAKVDGLEVLTGAFVPTFTSVTLSPSSAKLNLNGTQQFTATARDQNGNVFSPQPAFTWSVASGGAGSVSASGLYNSGATTGGATIQATSGGVTGSALVRVGVPVTTLFATGVDANGAPLADGVPDTHYAITSGPDGAGASAKVTLSDRFPVGGPYWLGDNASSKWVSPQADQSTSPEPPGTYVYRNTFDLTGYDPASVQLTGRMLADTQTSDVRLNGVSLGGLATSINTWTPLNIGSGFQPGINTLDFSITRTGSSNNPSGLRVELSGVATPSSSPPNGISEIHFYPRPGYPARMLGGRFQGSNDGKTYTDLYTITAQPPDSTWTTVVLSADLSAYRYLAYLSPSSSYGDISEVEFYKGTGAHGVRLTGMAFGSAGSYNNSGNDFMKVFDGDVNSFFEGPTPDGNYVGIDQQSQQMTLTQAGVAAGFSLTTFAAGFPQTKDRIGPLGITFPGSTVLVTDYPGHVRVFPTDADNQVAGSTSPSVLPTALYRGGDAAGLATLNGVIYMTQQATGQVIRVNADGTPYASNTFVASMPTATGIAADPVSGHLFVTSASGSGTGRIYEVDPATNTSSIWPQTFTIPDGITVSADGKTLYVVVNAASDSDNVVAFDVATRTQIWDYNATAAHTVISEMDGLALGYGSRSGFIYANANDGKVWQIALPGGTSPPGTATLIASGGSRGDFVAVDTSGQGALMLVQSDRILRLFPFPPPVACAPASLSALSLTATTGTVTLSGAALPGGQAVSLTSSNPAVLSVPASVLVPAGATSASFPVTVMPSSALVSVTVTAQYHSGPTQTASLTVDNYSRVLQGGSAVTFPATGTDGPSGTTYYGVDVISPDGTVVASTVNSGSLNGWSISDAGPYSNGNRFSVQAPTSAGLGAGYEIRAVYSGTNASAFFDVVSAMTPGGGSGGGASDSISAGGMTLTPAAIARGFHLKTFATFPQYPAASAVTSSGKVFVGTFFGGIMYVLPSDQDGQDGSLAPYISNGAFGMSTVDGDHVYQIGRKAPCFSNGDG